MGTLVGNIALDPVNLTIFNNSVCHFDSSTIVAYMRIVYTG